MHENRTIVLDLLKRNMDLYSYCVTYFKEKMGFWAEKNKYYVRSWKVKQVITCKKCTTFTL